MQYQNQPEANGVEAVESISILELTLGIANVDKDPTHSANCINCCLVVNQLTPVKTGLQG